MKAVSIITRPKVEKGVDWGVERIILARVDGKEMWWIKGYRAWDGNGMPWQYRPAKMLLVYEPDANGIPNHDELVAGTVRRTAKFFRDNASTINEFFGCDIAHLLGPKHTVISMA